MDFFTAQELSRRRSRRLLAIFAAACLLITLAVVAVVAAIAAILDGSFEWLLSVPGTWLRAHLGLLGVTALLTLALIGLSSAWRTARLAQGGGEIARALGGTEVPPDTRDPLRLRLRNVVEEMAIASGVPVPEIYVLENEGGINAFAAGFAPGDAAVAVTRGCLEQLDRDELQGVVAHEFSHILNGDMRLNIRLMGVLFGILVIGLVGRMLLQGGRLGAVRVRGSGRGGSGGAAALVVLGGLALVIIGSIGVFFGRVIRAGLSRQREFLADASAVQFTRSNLGIAGALRKIGGLDGGSHLTATDTEEVGHMLFARGGSAFRNLFATHPPISERLAALGVSADRAPASRGSATPHAQAASGGDPRVAGFAAAAVTAAVGQFDDAAIAYAGRLRAGLPPALDDAAHSRQRAPQLVLGLLLHAQAEVRQRQLALLSGQLGRDRSAEVATLAELAAAEGPAARLPLLELAFPAFKERPAAELDFHLRLAERLADESGELELFEYTLLRLVTLYLDQAAAPARRQAPRPGRRQALAAVADLLEVVATQGSADAAGAYRTGAAAFAAAMGDGVSLPSPGQGPWQARLDAALEVAAGLSPAARRQVVAALAVVIAHDGRTGIAELELLRVICATLECPLPARLPQAAVERVT